MKMLNAALNIIECFLSDVLSPILYSKDVNDCEIKFISDHCPYIEMLTIYFYIIYADDMVPFSETQDGLQLMLKALANYTKNGTRLLM